MQYIKIPSLSLVFALMVLIISCKSNQQNIMGEKGPNPLSGADTALGWQSLFDGQTIDQWRLYKGIGTDGWAVRDGEMIALGIEGKSADIISIDTYSNFELSLEWKISEKGNSGIFFNVREEEHLAAVYQSGPEYQLLDDKGYGDAIQDWQTTGANYAMHPPKVDATRPRGTYNHTRIIVDQGMVQHWLNDRLIVKYQLWTEEWETLKQEGKWKDYPSYGIYRSGHLALQDHGNEVSFRNIKIRRL